MPQSFGRVLGIWIAFSDDLVDTGVTTSPWRCRGGGCGTSSAPAPARCPSESMRAGSRSTTASIGTRPTRWAASCSTLTTRRGSSRARRRRSWCPRPHTSGRDCSTTPSSRAGTSLSTTAAIVHPAVLRGCGQLHGGGRLRRASDHRPDGNVLRQITRLARRTPSFGPRAVAIAVYADVGDNLVPAREAGFEGVACVDDAARALELYCALWDATRCLGARMVPGPARLRGRHAGRRRAMGELHPRLAGFAQPRGPHLARGWAVLAGARAARAGPGIAIAR